MALKRLFHALADEQLPESAAARAAQAGLSAVAPLYGAGAWTNRLLHEWGLRPRRALPAVVLSVGNITLGGTGKTPFAIWLARWLRREGRVPVVLTRGYAREDEDRLVVVHDGRRLRAHTLEAGDEPVLVATALGDTPVVACADRYRAGRFALRRFACDTMLLDDGFQHVALERQGEIVLLDATRPLGGLRLFPRGTLREPLGALERAHLIVLTRCDESRRSQQMARTLRQRHPGTEVVRTRLRPTRLVRLQDGEARSLAWLSGKRVVLACGVGNPDSVRRAVEKLGALVVVQDDLADHARPTRAQVAEWERLRRHAHCHAIVVTEKDAVKLRELGNLPRRLLALGAEMEFVTREDEERAERVLRARLRVQPVRGYLAGK